MTDNMKYIVNTVTGMINSKFGDELPTIEDIHSEAETIRAAFSNIYPVTDEELKALHIIKKEIDTNEIVDENAFLFSRNYNVPMKYELQHELQFEINSLIWTHWFS